MAVINTALLIGNATELASRGIEVQQDPAVRKACREAWSDVKKAGESIGQAASEIHSAWRRTDRATRTYPSGVYA